MFLATIQILLFFCGLMFVITILNQFCNCGNGENKGTSDHEEPRQPSHRSRRKKRLSRRLRPLDRETLRRICGADLNIPRPIVPPIRIKSAGSTVEIKDLRLPFWGLSPIEERYLDGSEPSTSAAALVSIGLEAPQPILAPITAITEQPKPTHFSTIISIHRPVRLVTPEETEMMTNPSAASNSAKASGQLVNPPSSRSNNNSGSSSVSNAGASSSNNPFTPKNPINKPSMSSSRNSSSNPSGSNNPSSSSASTTSTNPSSSTIPSTSTHASNPSTSTIPSTSTNRSNLISPINTPFFLNFANFRSYTYAGSSGITKPAVSGTRRGLCRTIRRYSDSDQSIAKTVIQDIDFFSESGSSYGSVNGMHRIAGDGMDSPDLDQALFIRELSRSITMDPVIPGTHTRQPRLTILEGVAPEEV